MIPLSLLVIEDDPFFRSRIEKVIVTRFPQIAVIAMSSEPEFLFCYETIRQSPPSAIVVDAFLTDDPHDLTGLENHLTTDYFDDDDGDILYVAGLRIARKLGRDPALASVPVALYSVLDFSVREMAVACHPSLSFVRKDMDDRLAPPETLGRLFGIADGAPLLWNGWDTLLGQ